MPAAALAAARLAVLALLCPPRGRAAAGASSAEGGGGCGGRGGGPCAEQLQHVLLTEGSYWTEGVGAKWRTVKYGLWLALRVNYLLRARGVENATLAWLPNPAEMQNPQAGAPSMMGGLGILQPTAPPPALTGKTPQWLHGQIDAGAYQRVALGFRMPGPADDSLERAVLERVLASAGPGPAVPLAFVLAGTPPEPMHWHGRAGAWLHTAFFSHRLARRARALAAASPTAGGGGAPPRLPLPSGVHEGQYVVAVHLRHFELPGWNLPGSYFLAAIRAIFEHTGLSCDNAAVRLVGRVDTPAALEILDGVPCSGGVPRHVPETRDEPQEDPHAGDDYGAADDASDARHGFVFADLELMGLSDFLVSSHSEFSALAHGLSSPHTITLCPPRRAKSGADADDRVACDRTGVPNSVLTHPARWGRAAAPLDRVAGVDEAEVGPQLRRLWEARVRGIGGEPLRSRRDQGIVAAFDPGAEVEAYWPRPADFARSSRPASAEWAAAASGPVGAAARAPRTSEL